MATPVEGRRGVEITAEVGDGKSYIAQLPDGSWVAGGKWYIAQLPDGSWAAWNDGEPTHVEVFASRLEALEFQADRLDTLAEELEAKAYGSHWSAAQAADKARKLFEDEARRAGPTRR